MTDDDLVTIYEAASFAEAEMIHQALEAEEVEAWVDQTASPLDGLTSAGQGTPIMVREEDTERAKEVIDRYLNERESSLGNNEEES